MKTKTISKLLNSLSTIIYYIGSFWLGASLNIIGDISVFQLGFYLIVVPIAVGYLFTNNLTSVWYSVIYFLTTAYFICSVGWFTNFGIWDVRVYTITVPVIITMSIYILNRHLNVNENWNKIVEKRNKYKMKDDEIVK